MPGTLFAVGGDSLLGGFDQGGPPPDILAVGAVWSAAITFVLLALLLRWYAPSDWDPAGRRWLALAAAGLVALIATSLSANLEHGLVGGLVYLGACLVATIALPLILVPAYLLGPRRRRRRGKPSRPADPLDFGIDV